MFPLKLHVLLPLVMHCKSGITDHLLYLCDFMLLSDQLTLFRMYALEHIPQLFCLLLPFNSLPLKCV